MKANELREKEVPKLKDELASLQRAYFTMRMEKATAQLSNTASLKYARRDIARAKTVLTEKLKGAAQ